MFLLQCDRLGFAPYKTTDKIIILPVLILTLLDSKLDDKILDRMVADIRVQSVLDFFISAILIC